MSAECQTAEPGMAKSALDLPGPSRRITVEPVEAPVTEPAEVPATDPQPGPEREPAPDREPEKTPAEV